MKFVFNWQGAHRTLHEVVSNIAMDLLKQNEDAIKFPKKTIKQIYEITSVYHDLNDRIKYNIENNLAVIDKLGIYRLDAVFCVLENSDKTRGAGPMLPKAYFNHLADALDYANDLPGVQGRNYHWIYQKAGDVQIELIPIFDTAMECHMLLDVPQYDVQAYEQAKLQYERKCVALIKAGFTSDDLKVPVKDDFRSKPTRSFSFS